MKISPQKHYIFLGIIVIITIGLLASTFFFTNKKSRKFVFAPTRTVIPTQASYRKLETAIEGKESWKTFKDDELKYSIQYPENVILDDRQTARGRITVFVFEEDKTASLPGNVTGLYLADTHKKGIDGFTAFSRSDCGNNCKVPYQKADWVTFNNAYGIRNPLASDISNWYLTDKEQKGTVINAYVGGKLAKGEKKVDEKVKLFEEMIETITFNR